MRLPALLFCTLLAASPALATPAVETNESEGQLPLQELRMFVDALEKIRAAHVEPVTDSELLKHAIQGMLSNLDPHSAFLDTEDFQDLQDATSGAFGGLGMEVAMEDGLVRVVSPIDDTPAQRAGIESGDLIVRMDDEPVMGMNLKDAIDRLRGEAGTTIRLTLLREGSDQPIELTLTRAIIQVRSVRSRSLEPGFGYIRIAQFQEDTGAEFERALNELQQQPLKGLVLDLRNNPGGVLQSSAQVVDALLDSGRIVYTEGRLPGSDMRFDATPGDLSHGTPIVVLINGGSASASEIVAGALQDHRRAIVLGTTSFGKGSVQSVMPLSETQAIKLTTARYFTPSGRSIQAEGIVPDIVIERVRIAGLETASNPFRVSEAQLKGHLQNKNETGKGSKTAANEEDNPLSLLERDNQLYEALNLLKGISILGQAATAQ